MSGIKRLVVGRITQGDLKGKALESALYEGLCHGKEVQPAKAEKKYASKPKKK